jgi:hypothetical protein
MMRDFNNSSNYIITIIANNINKISIINLYNKNNQDKFNFNFNNNNLNNNHNNNLIIKDIRDHLNISNNKKIKKWFKRSPLKVISEEI